MNDSIINSACHDNQADYYDEHITNDVKNSENYIREKYFEVHQEAIRMLNLSEGEVLLDIGIGTGLLEEKIDGKVEVYGVDISEKMMEKIKEKKIKIMELKKGSFTDIPYKKNMFDAIVSCFAFHHLSDAEKENSIFEMKRVLKENGRIVIGDFMYLNENSKKDLITKFQNEKRIDMIEEMKDENFTNIEKFIIALRKNEFKAEFKQVSTISWVIKASLNNE